MLALVRRELGYFRCCFFAASWVSGLLPVCLGLAGSVGTCICCFSFGSRFGFLYLVSSCFGFLPFSLLPYCWGCVFVFSAGWFCFVICLGVWFSRAYSQFPSSISLLFILFRRLFRFLGVFPLDWVLFGASLLSRRVLFDVGSGFRSHLLSDTN